MVDLSFINIDATIADLPYHVFQVSSSTKVSIAVKRFEQDLLVPAVIVLNSEGLIINMISRCSFLELMSKPYSIELFTNQPLRKIIPFIPSRAIRLPARISIDEAARIVLSRTDDLISEPIIAIAQDGLRIIECHTILHAHSKILSMVNASIKVRNRKLIAEIKAREQLEAELSYTALHDGLTGLPNRVLFKNRLEQAFKYYQRSSDRVFGIMFIDLDRFKLVNDTLGHESGDLLLVQVGDRLRSTLRNVDTVARLGGDEFAVLLDEITDITQAEICASRIELNINRPFDLANGHQVFIGASIGIAIVSSQYHTPQELLRDADMAMYQAKKQGKSSYIFSLVNSVVIQNNGFVPSHLVESYPQ